MSRFTNLTVDEFNQLPGDVQQDILREHFLEKEAAAMQEDPMTAAWNKDREDAEEAASKLDKIDEKRKNDNSYGYSGHHGSGGSYSPYSGSSYGSSGGKQTTYIQKCRHKATPAFKMNEITYCGASRSLVEDQIFGADTLVICLLGHPPIPLYVGHPKWASLKKFVAPPHQAMSIDWPDYGEPPVAAGFWIQLHDLVQKNGIKQVIFYCEGGHGRTGTALASMLVEVSDMDPLEAVKFVRKSYCKEAVESKSQAEYLMYLAEVRPDIVSVHKSTTKKKGK